MTIFISYSRADKDFADRLAEALENWQDSRIKVLIDRRDLPYGHKWWDMLVDFIRRCDRVVFVVSPESIHSEWCKKELDEIAKFGRRLVPIVVREAPMSEIPKAITDVQLLPFTPPNEFDAQIPKLVRALIENPEWTRQRRVIDNLADHWEAKNRPQSLLLRPHQVKTFEEWSAERPEVEPPLAEQTAAFLDFSRFDANKEGHFRELRSRRESASSFLLYWFGLVAGAVVVIGAGCFAAVNFTTNPIIIVFAWLTSAVAGVGIAWPIGGMIAAARKAAIEKTDQQAAFIEQYGAIKEAEMFIEAEIERERAESKLKEDQEELKKLRADKAKLEKEAAAKSRQESTPVAIHPVPASASATSAAAGGLALPAGQRMPTSGDPMP